MEIQAQSREADFEDQSNDTRIFILSAIAMSVAVWDIAFFLGVFNTVFFEKVFAIWAAATGALLASFFVPGMTARTGLGTVGRIILALPSLWLVAALIDNTGFQTVLSSQALFWSAVVSGVVSLPYMIYVAVIMATPDLLNLRRRRYLVILVAIVGMVAALSFAAGRANHLLLTCADFKVSGNDLPARCATPR